MEESAAAAAAASVTNGDDEDDEAVDMSSRNDHHHHHNHHHSHNHHNENRKISVTRLTPSPSPHQLSPPSSSRSASPLSPNYMKSSNNNGQTGKMAVDSMTAAFQLQLAAAASRNRFTIDGLMLDPSAPGSQSGGPQPHPVMFGGHGPHPHGLLHANGHGGQQTQPGWMGHPGAHLAGLPGGHPINPFHWLGQSNGPLSPSHMSKSHFFSFFFIHTITTLNYIS